MPVYWGDLHNHCAVSYGRTRPQRALANAMEQLDFCSITGHAFWPDMPMKLDADDQRIGTHWGGFAKLQYYWPELLELLRAANRDGEFVTLPSYEWHSNVFGDHNVYLNADTAPLTDGCDLASLVQALRRQEAPFMLLPHHLGYASGHRGANWAHFDDAVSPLVEVFSNHGSCEADDSPYEYHHLMGPRVGEQLVREGLVRRHRFGFYASTDTHDGYPGHYGHGRVGVIASALTRQGIWEAMEQRRTIATTGAHIIAEAHLNDAEVGQIARRRRTMPLRIAVRGTSSITGIQLVESDHDQWRVRALLPPVISPRLEEGGRYRLRVELGWGGETHQWNVRLTVQDGQILGVQPYFRFNGLDDHDEPCDRIGFRNSTELQWTCRTSPNPSGQMGGTHFNAGGTQSVLIEIDASNATRVVLESQQNRLEAKLSDLAARSIATHIDGTLHPAMKLHRAVPRREFELEYEERYEPAGDGDGWIYLRVVQSDGQVAWLSPIWWTRSAETTVQAAKVLKRRQSGY